MIHYFDFSVLEAAQRRIAKVFDAFENIFVSVSSGKDSSCLYWLCVAEAEKRNRKINVFFLDQEAEYQGSIEIMRQMMSHPSVIPHWYQVPCYMTNATSYSQDQLYAWGEGEDWMRPKEDIAIKSIDGDYPKRFYKFFDWFEQQQTEPTAFLVGLRSKESMNRFRAVTKNPGYDGIPWSTKTKNVQCFRFYPIYDWTFGDVWKYISDNHRPYNPVYDRMYCLKGKKLNDIRISNLIHEKSFACLTELQEIEPETYEKLCKRLQGVHSAAIYAHESMIYQAKELPKEFASWKEYRDSLLESAPMSEKYRGRLRKRFAEQPDIDEIHRQQCKQVLICDAENNIPVNTKATSKDQLKAKWWDRL
ncbi:MAG: phosphoadenosine phosphosulfate reductase family protein [Bacilli bacterium]|jgi:predicted phosphoadenosine phosphosulfate sulfurtransferase